MGKKTEPPVCPGCSKPARLALQLTQGGDKLKRTGFWVCHQCGAVCACHPGSFRPLGVPALKELRDARDMLLDQMLAPLWKTAVASTGAEPEDMRARKMIENAARSRTYSYLAHRLGITREECHVALFDIERCRAAWKALKGISYPEIRLWAKETAAPRISHRREPDEPRREL